MNRFLLAAAAAAVLGAAPLQAQFLLCVESTNDQVVLIDASDGSLVSPAYITLAPAGPDTPREACVVNNEIWVTDQTADKIMRFSLDGTTWLGNYGVGSLNNCRGGAFVNGVFYVTNFQAIGTTPADCVVRFDTAGTVLGTFPRLQPFDVLEFQGGLLVTGAVDDDLARFDLAGNALGVFHDSDGITGIDLAVQISLNNAGNVLAGGLITPSGIYEYDAATGAQVNYWSAPGPVRGVEQLGDGRYICSSDVTATGIRIFDPANGQFVTVMYGVDAHFFTEFAGPAPTSPELICAGDGTLTDHTTPCPCGNDATIPGNGCAHSFFAGGARLGWSGVPAGDNVVLTSTLTPNSAFTLFVQHDVQSDINFHDGVLCASGTLIRLRGRSAVGGTASFPNSALALDASVTLSQRGQVTVGSGATRYYAAWYRNASTSFCPPATANVTNGVKITW